MSSRNKAIVRYDSNDSESGESSQQSSNRRTDNEERSDRNDQQLNDEQLNRIVCDSIKYLLIGDHKKLPIKRSDLFKTVLKNSYSRKTNDLIMRKVTSSLSETFAIDLVECPESANTYILVNKLSIDGINESVDCDSIPESQHYRSALLTSVLALIFMSGQTIHEDLMWKFLDKLGFDVNSKQLLPINDDSNGITIKKLLTELWVRQLYLKYIKIERSEPIAHEFKWGFRAEKEFNKMDIIKFVCNVYGDNSEPNYWRNQYQIAINEQNITEESDIDIIVDH